MSVENERMVPTGAHKKPSSGRPGKASACARQLMGMLLRSHRLHLCNAKQTRKVITFALPPGMHSLVGPLQEVAEHAETCSDGTTAPAPGPAVEGAAPAVVCLDVSQPASHGTPSQFFFSLVANGCGDKMNDGRERFTSFISCPVIPLG